MNTLTEQQEENQTHDDALAAIPTDNITDIIKGLVNVYLKLYEVDAWHINCGMCEEFATDVCDLMGGETDDLRLEWNDGIIGCNQNSNHCVIIYKDKFYDSQHPEGSKIEEFLKWEIWK